MEVSQELIIEAGRADANYWYDLWRFRELLAVLVWRDLAIRYKETVFGILWSIGRPFVTMIILTIVFARLAKLPSDGNIPYPLLVLVGLLVWNFFSASLADAVNSLVRDSSLITKVYFPRLIVPTASIAVSLIDFLISFAILAILMIWYRFLPSWQILLLPFFVIFAFLASLGPCLWASSLNVKYRDFRFLVPFVIQFGLYISPVGFTSSVVPENWRFIYSLNPAVGIIDGFRWCTLGQSKLYLPGFFWSVIATAILLQWGIWHFRKVEKSFADVL